MLCPSCEYDNPSQTRFCGSCGSLLRSICPKCGSDNPLRFKFCGACGASLNTGDPTTLSPAATATDALPEGERKTITALFADIKGSTELMRDLDPEEARAIVDPVLQLMMAAVHRYSGYVAQSTGDGIFALFGAPVAHEDHPQRALHAALAMQEELHRFADRLRTEGKIPVEARVGVNTGEVVVRTIETGGHTEYTPVGHVTNLAARMQTAAPAGSIAASEATQRLCEGYFEFRALGPTAVKGLDQPVEVFEVTGLGSLRTHFQLSERRGLTRFVGREREMAVMAGALEAARVGHGQIVAAVGEAGAGKSRLMYEFKATIPDGCKVLEVYSVSHGKASAWLPVIELLKSYFEIADEDDDARRSEKIEAKARALDPALAETLPYILSLLGIAGAGVSLAMMDARIRRRRTLEAVKRMIVRESLKQPLVVIFEDLHWIDAETQELLDLLVDSVASARILMLVNFRLEYRHAWGNRTCYAQLRLDPLGGQSADEMLQALLGGDASLESLKPLITEKTQGNPFFMEEIVRALVEQGVLVRNGAIKLAKPLTEIRIPPTVHGILAARIDALPASEKILLQTLAVIGKDFPLNLVRHIAASRDDRVEPMLKSLRAGEFIYERPASGEAEYTFKHALTQEVAYHSILAERRKTIHERVGSAIEEIYREQLEEHLADLAYHYRRSSDNEKAVAYLKRAADQAAQRSSVTVAEAQYRDALSVLKELPPTPERDRLELKVQSGLAAVLIGKGFGASPREESLIRATKLCDRVGDRRGLLGLLFQRGQFYIGRLRWREARQLAEEAIALAQSVDDQILEGGAWHNLAESCFFSGDLVAAKARCEKALGLLANVPPELLVSLFGLDLWMISSHFAGVIELILGRPDRSLEWENRLVERAGSSSHVYSKALGMVAAGWIATVRRDLGKAGDRARIARRICEEHGFGELLNLAMGYEGYSRFWQGETEVGVAQQKRAIEELEALGTRNRSSWRIAWLAEAQLQLGELSAAESSLERAFEIVKETGEGWAEPEVHRVSAEAIMRKPGGDMLAAQRRFEEAVAIARKQDSKWWELRATVGLARLLYKQGRQAEARAMLAEIYSWFTEGFDTADLKDAKALLEELGA
jgi:class 3 adenylate cyclase/tetratricopeptide (TPR) repeat protein